MTLTTFRRCLRHFLLLAAGTAVTAAAQAQAYPTRPITFIYGYPAGSVSDTAWRSIVQEASRRLGQPIVYENRPGASGRIGLNAVMRATPDGYTIGIFNNAQLVVSPLIDPKLAIEPGKHYAPLLVGIESYLLMVARPNLPFKDMPGLIAYAKANPGKLNAASPGQGTGSHLALAMVSAQAGIDYVIAHYKGAAPTLQAILSGEVDVMFTDLMAKPHVDSGRLLGLGVSGPQRWSLMPNLPTLKESAGLPSFQAVTWQGVLAPLGLPMDVAVRLNRAFNDALNTPELRGKLESAGWSIRGGSAQEAVALIQADMEVYRPIVKAANIKLD